MTQRQWEELDRTIAEMSEDERMELRARIDLSLRRDPVDGRDDERVARQRSAFRRVMQRIAASPPGPDPYAGMGYSDRAHDKILYDLEQE